MKYFIVVVFFIMGASEIRAETYLDVGVTSMIRDKYSYRQHDGSEIHVPMGQIELGYTYKRVTLFVQHTSDMATSKDSGLNLVGVKLRLF